jgi:CRP-like cAMP-binding protein
LAAVENHLIELLPRKDRLHFLSRCESVELVMSDVLAHPGKETRHAYFPTEGIISLIAPIDGRPALEVGMVGWEGMFCAQLALGVTTQPLHALVQGAGEAWRISASNLRAELETSPALQRILNRYVTVVLAQLATSAACLRFHQIGPRLARWLLMTHDRSHADSFHMTQEFIAYMLGVRRVGITAAAGMFQRNGLISYHRGTMTVLDRTGLEAAACRCYATEKRLYETPLAGIAGPRRSKAVPPPETHAAEA